MPTPTSGNPISFGDLNTNAGLPELQPSSDIETLGNLYSLKPTTAPSTGNWSDSVAGLSMSEFHNKTGNPYYPPSMTVDNNGGAQVFYLEGGGTYTVSSFPASSTMSATRTPFNNSLPAPIQVTVSVPPSGLPGPATNFSGTFNLSHPVFGSINIPIVQQGPGYTPPTPTPTPTQHQHLHQHQPQRLFQTPILLHLPQLVQYQFMVVVKH